MNKIAKRMVAGASAAVLFVSAVWSDAFMGLLRGTIYADSVEENGIMGDRDFKDPQQDTRIDDAGNKVYNTNYGLHTDKTLSKAYSDGRTFDVDLESWYIGEKPADVGMVLDASGSMAWTTQNPTAIPFDVKDLETFKSEYDIDQNVFLTNDQLSHILETKNTDNSKISYTGYQYYVYEARASVSEFVPLGYWDGTLQTADTKLRGYYPFDNDDRWANKVVADTDGKMITVTKGNPSTTDNGEYKSGSPSKGIEIGKTRFTASTPNDDYRGMFLDASPTILEDNTFEFTLSFALKSKNDDSVEDWQIFRFGNDEHYWNIKVPSSDKGLTVRSETGGGPTNGSAGVFNKNYAFYTFVFYKDANNKLNYCLYRDGELVRDVYTENKGDTNKNLGDFSNLIKDKKVDIIFDPCGDDGSGTVYVDDIYFFDKAMSADEVKSFVTNAKEQNVPKEIELTDRAANEDGNVLAQLPDALQKAAAAGTSLAGWYYVNSAQDWEPLDDPDIGTGKQFQGLKTDGKDSSYYIAPDFATVPLTADEKIKDLINAGNDIGDDGIKLDTKDGASPVKFFIDSQGYLRCFFNSGGDSDTTEITKFNEFISSPYDENDKLKPYTTEVRTQCSLVYQKQDGADIKTQTLNKVLNYFIGEVQKSSSKSKISAMRFSNNNMVLNKEKKGIREGYEDNLKELLLLDWTSKEDIEKNEYSKDLAGRREGLDDNTKSSVNVEGSDLYNYFLTGGTNTWVGLKAFADNLASEVKTDSNNKYLIVFTDGRDTLESSKDTDKKDIGYVNNILNDVKPEGSPVTSSEQLASAWADELKKQGYTIFCVMMASGSISPDMPTVAGEDKSEYEKAKDFLGTIASNTDYVYAADSAENLQAAFTSILTQIQKPLTNYTVQDYIDPRFDLVDKDGNVIQFGAGGNITVNGEGFTLTDAYAGSRKFYEYLTKDGRTAKIYYDNKTDMYYLRWDEVTIPGYTSPFEGDSIKVTDGKFEVWKSTITLRAKEDFIGGNAILTNGNEAGMNLVFKTGSETVTSGNASERLKNLSGTDKSVDYKDGNSIENMTPSKGFPRVTCNVRLLDITTKPLNNVIYLGEVVSPAYMLSELEDGYMEGSYYLEYLKRYAHRLYPEDMDTPLLQLLNAWLGINDPGKTDKSFTIPYIYLPNPKYDGKTPTGEILNNAGGELNQKDIVGYLTYSWERAGKVEPQQDGDITKEYVVKDTEQIKYNLKLTFTPLHEDDAALDEFKLNENFIKDKETFFHVNDDGNFDANSKWEIDTRVNFLKALVDDKSGGSTNDVYEWDPGYKPTQGDEQVEPGGKYGDAVVDENGFSLVANTTYTKDVVNAGLALELLVKGSDLQGDTNIKNNSEFKFTATRNYNDDLDPLPYKETGAGGEMMYADATNETYQLTFTVVADTFPSAIDNDQYYTIWATLTNVTKGSEVVKNGLPIGTYTITYDGTIPVTGSDYFTNFNADTNRGNFIFSRFPENVYKVSESAAKSTGDAEYLIHGTSDFAKENIAKTEKDASTNTLTFYFGTDPDEKDNQKGKSRIQDPDSEYTKDRLGIMVLSYGSNNLTISKEVTSKNIPEIHEQAVLDNRWIFDVKLITQDESTALSPDSFNLKWTDANGNVKTGDGYPAKITFEEASTKPAGVTGKVYVPTDGGTISVKSGEQVTILQLPEGVEYEVSENRAKQTEANDFREGYRYTIIVDDDRDESPDVGTSTGELTPTSAVNFINEFPSPELPSAGGDGINLTVYTGIVLILAGGIWLILLRRKAHSRDKPSEGGCP